MTEDMTPRLTDGWHDLAREHCAVKIEDGAPVLVSIAWDVDISEEELGVAIAALVGGRVEFGSWNGTMEGDQVCEIHQVEWTARVENGLLNEEQAGEIAAELYERVDGADDVKHKDAIMTELVEWLREGEFRIGETLTLDALETVWEESNERDDNENVVGPFGSQYH